jgi:hypothetical protein
MWPFLLLYLCFVYVLGFLFFVSFFAGIGFLGGGKAFLIFGAIAFPILRLAPLLFTKKKISSKIIMGIYFICLSFDVLVALLGLHTLRQSDISAAHGGGLLGGFGFLYVGAAIIFNAVSLLGILGIWARKRYSSKKDLQA